jgi:glutamate N-acetyltransferase / amino-acid N-acetyltransferase
VLPFSTGVIGQALPVDRIVDSIPGAFSTLTPEAWMQTAAAIMTTDTIAKGISRSLTISGKPVVITGIAKGAGMIRPDMATMLAFIATDAGIEPPLLRELQREAVEVSFNRITVDGDTSTNDACVLVATGRSDVRLGRSDEGCRRFSAALTEVMVGLAQAIVRDGEGATKFITVRVRSAANLDEARQVAYTIAHSPLVKTAFFASDPNWGRILAAIGRAGIARLEIGKVEIFLDDLCVVRQGELSPDYTEAAGRQVMAKSEIAIRVNLNRGAQDFHLWTSDLSYDYVRINAEYRS